MDGYNGNIQILKSEEVENLGVGKSIEELRDILSQEILIIRANLTFVSNGMYIYCIEYVGWVVE